MPAVMEGTRKVPFRLRIYDSRMRRRTFKWLPIAIFATLALALDYVSVAAIFEAGFEGVQRVLLTVLGLVVGTVSAFVLTRPLVLRLASR
jgi:hypothetical protein